jgi:hypothetical protein
MIADTFFFFSIFFFSGVRSISIHKVITVDDEGLRGLRDTPLQTVAPGPG